MVINENEEFNDKTMNKGIKNIVDLVIKKDAKALLLQGSDS